MSKQATSDNTSLGPILVPVDFSKHSQAALQWACDQAKPIGARVIVLHVVHDLANAPGYYNQDSSDLMKPMEDVAEKMMKRFLKDSGKEVGDKKYYKQLEWQLVVGLPVTRILEVAKKSRASQIIMGSQGRTGLKRLLIGSKAEQVLRMSKLPVTIVKVSEED